LLLGPQGWGPRHKEIAKGIVQSKKTILATSGEPPTAAKDEFNGLFRQANVRDLSIEDEIVRLAAEIRSVQTQRQQAEPLDSQRGEGPGYEIGRVAAAETEENQKAETVTREAEEQHKVEEAARQGHALAQNNLGFMYEKGRGGLEKSDAEAVRYYKLAADQGYALAQNNLGVMYEKGRGGLEKSDAEAVRYYKLAADQANTLAQCNLGRMYENGRGGLEKSDAEAVQYYRLAADQGHASAQYNLGRMYENSRGSLEKTMPPDIIN
jgi:TPR repeat protein